MRKTSPHVLLVEDSASQAALLRPLLASMGRAVLGPLTAAAALQHYTNVLPDLAILNIDPANADLVLQLAWRLRRAGSIPIIFTTATDSQSLLARIWQTAPVVVLPRPYRLPMLHRAMERGLAMACGGLGEGGPGPVFVHEQQLLVRVQPADVLCIQQHDKYCQLWLDPNRCHTVRRSLAQLLEQLPAAFAQVHRAWAVHLRHIQAVAPAAGFVYLSHEMRVPVGRSYRRQLRQCLMLPGQAAD